MTETTLTFTHLGLYMACVGAAITAILQACKGLVPRRVQEHELWVRTMPVTPLAMGVLCMLVLVGRSVEGVPLPAGALCVLGVVAGGFSGHLYKLVRQTIQRQDRRLDQVGRP